MMDMPARVRVSAEEIVERRLETELEKAVEKYGDDALHPGGHPDLDIADYALNELVGLIRYGKMIEHRYGEAQRAVLDDPGGRFLLEQLEVLGARIARRGKQLATELMVLHTRARGAGLETGEQENV